MKLLGLLLYKSLDFYNPNVFKGDLLVLEKEFGKDWFFSLMVVLDMLIEGWKLFMLVGV